MSAMAGSGGEAVGAVVAARGGAGYVVPVREARRRVNVPGPDVPVYPAKP